MKAACMKCWRMICLPGEAKIFRMGRILGFWGEIFGRNLRFLKGNLRKSMDFVGEIENLGKWILGFRVYESKNGKISRVKDFKIQNL